MAAAVLLSAHLLLVLDWAARHSAVMDEVVYPTSGYAYLTRGDYRFNPEHPPLMKLWTGAAWLGMGIPVEEIPGWNEREQYLFGQSLIYGEGVPHRALLVRARAMVALLSAACGFAIYRLALRLAGPAGGVLALALWVFDPLVVSQAGVATTDLGGAAFYFLAALAIPGALHRGGRWRPLLAGLALGLALAAKFTNLLLLAVLGAAAGYGAFRAIRGGRGAASGIARLAARAAAVAAVGAAVLFATYGPAGPGVYFEGLGILRGHFATGHKAFAFGQYAETGFWWYFPAAWAIKTPIPILLAGAGGVVALAWGWKRRPALTLVLLAAPALVAASAVSGSLNIGVRHLLNATPFLAVGGGVALARAARRGWIPRIGVVALVVWLALGTLRVHPDEFAYANETIGGPRNLWRYLVDSNVDWGQDLPALAEEVGRQPLRRLYLAYFGSADPKAYGLRYCWIPSAGFVPRWSVDGPDPGGREWIAVSVTNLHDVFFGRRDVSAWLRERPFTAFPGHSIALFDITGDVEAHRRIARTAVAFGEARAAEPALRRTLELDPSDAQSRIDLIRVLAAQDKMEEAGAACREAEGLVPAGLLPPPCR